MSDIKQLELLKRNPYAIQNMENPTEEMAVVALEQNGMLLEKIKLRTPTILEAAVNQAPRSIKFVENPSEDILFLVIDKGWNNLSYIENPSLRVIEYAIRQSGWAIKYVEQPSEALQLLAVEQTYDAIQFITNPTKAVQIAAVKQNYQALRFIKDPCFEAECLAISQDEKAMRFVRSIDKEKFLRFFALNSLVIRYMPQALKVSADDLERVLKAVLSRTDINERYVRDFINCPRIGKRQGDFILDKVSLIDAYGSKKAKQITVDEKLKF